ncbi:riboflavin biosynthesis protein RibF [Porphyromonadaceae bacterium W3.11]|nr:riboflavin biosynthesis protein RibF [Porphyromonadaceae bacterium W3.11]
MNKIGKAKIYHSVEELQSRDNQKPLVATLGLFDGVHLGHQHLINAMQMMAKDLGAESLIITLDRHPTTVLSPNDQPPLKISSLRERLRLLSNTGADHILVLPFTKDLSKQPPTKFIAPILDAGMIGMMLGYDNRFGKKMLGETVESFDHDLESIGLTIRRVSTYEDGGIPVSSSRIRYCLAQKNFTQIEQLLGRPYSLSGRVTGGRQIGRTINYPTANIVPEDPNVILPEVGVYISEVIIDNKIYTGMSYYGSTPTVSNGGIIQHRIEVFVFDFEGYLYDKELTISFRKFIRPDEKFASLEELQKQLEADEKVSREFFVNHPILLKI